MSVSGIVHHVLGTAGALVTRPVEVVRKPIGAAKTVAGTGLTAAEALAHTVADRLRQRHTPLRDEELQADPGRPSDVAETPADEVAVDERGPVLREPGPPAQPPVDVVEQALAADHEGAGRTTEPRGASRDEEHGDAALQRAEEEEIAEEAVEGTPAGEVAIETPVGTTGADTGFNPDTAEADLQQPATEPLLDPGSAKAVRAEADTLSRGADTDKS